MIKNNGDLSDNTLEIFKKASILYDVLKLQDIKINLDTNGITIISDVINNNDKKLLSLLLAFFFVDCGAYKVLNDFNFKLSEVLNRVYDNDNNIFLEEEQLAEILCQKDKSEINEELEKLLKIILNDYGYLSSEGLLIILYDASYSGSRLINLLLPCILEDCSPFTDSKAFYDICSKIAFDKEKEKIAENSYVEEKVNNLNRKYSNNFISLFGLNKETKDEDILKKYGTYLTEVSYKSNPAIGREKELEKAKVTLLTSDKSLMLVGPGGVGKTAIVEGLAYDIQNGLVPESLKNKKIISINTSDLVKGCKWVGSFEEVVEKILKAIESDKDIILFIDEIHTVFGLGAGSHSTLDFANILKPYLSRGKIKMIGATTTDEYESFIQNDSAFKRRFERLDVKEPHDKLLFEIMREVINKYEDIYNIKFLNNEKDKDITLDLISKTTEQAKRVYSDKSSNPDLVILIIEKAFSYAIYNEHKYVMKDDIVRAIMDCDRIYESVREETKDIIEKKLSNNKDVRRKVKVIDFKTYRK